MIAQVGDVVRVMRTCLDGEFNIPPHLDNQIAEVLAVHPKAGGMPASWTGRINGDPIPLPLSAIGEIIGHGVGKARLE